MTDGISNTGAPRIGPSADNTLFKTIVDSNIDADTINVALDTGFAPIFSLATFRLPSLSNLTLFENSTIAGGEDNDSINASR